MRQVHLFVIIVSVGLVGCLGTRAVECRDEASCDLQPGGACLSAPSGNQWCAYPDASCPGGMRYSDFEIGDGLSGVCVGPEVDAASVDASSSDARVDAAPGQAAFDVGFVSEWVIGGEPGSMTPVEWVRIVNRGTEPLDLGTGIIVAVVDNHPMFTVTATWGPASTILQPGMAAGALSPDAAQRIVTSGLMSEPPQNTMENLLTMTVSNFPPSGAWAGLQVDLTIQIANARATLPVVVGNSGTNPNPRPTAAMRGASVPAP